MILLFLCIGLLLFFYGLLVFFIFCGKKRHNFWNNQSVSYGTMGDSEKMISSNPMTEELSDEVVLLDHTNNDVVKEVSDFLKGNYIENSNVNGEYLKWYFSYPCKH